MVAAYPLIGSLVAAAVTVEGATGCPEARQVEERLRPLVPRDDVSAGVLPDVVHLAQDGAALVVTVVRPDGTVVGTRRLAGGRRCDELADAVAVIVASWQLDGAGRERTPELPAEEARRPLPTLTAGGDSTSLLGKVRWELAAGVGVATTGGGDAPSALAPGGLLEAAAWGWEGRLGFWARASASGQREIAFDAPGAAAWRRASLALGPAVGWRFGRLRLEARLGAGMTWLSVEGRGLTNPRRHDDALGVVASAVRLALERTRWVPWVEVGASVWAVRTHVHALPEGESMSLPPFEMTLALGLSLRL